MVYFVGAGPGAEDLITVRGLNYLRQADVIIYAGSLVNPALLKEAKQDCEIYNSAYMALDEVIAVMEEAERRELFTVRLHTGDPSIYGAIREQMDELDKRGIAFSVCPGVSSLFGAASALQVEYTLPGVSQSVIISRAEGRTPVPEQESIRKLAAHQSTMVLFLSSGLAEKVREELLAGGYCAETPVAVVYKATWPEEKILHTTIEKLPEDMAREGINKTALIVVGNVLGKEYQKSKLYDAAFTTGFRKGTVREDIAPDFGINTIVLIACSIQAYEVMKELEHNLKIGQQGSKIICLVKCSSLGEVSDRRSLKEMVGEWFYQCDAMIFIGSSGIAVRSIAPYIRHKSIDPAVIVLDGKADHCISLLSGHAGGANDLARKIAQYTGAVPVVTTATDLDGKFAVDDFARKNQMAVMDWDIAKRISAGILEGERIGVYSEIPLTGELPSELFFIGKDSSGLKNSLLSSLICISYRPLEYIPMFKEYRESSEWQILTLVPKLVVVGIGCRKGTPEEKINDAVAQCLREQGIRKEALCVVASIELKREEKGLLDFCRGAKLKFLTYSAQELLGVEGEFSSSPFVEEVTGVPCVCERSAVLAAGKECELLCRKKIYNGVAIALAAKKGKGIV